MELTEYKSHKIVHASPMTLEQYDAYQFDVTKACATPHGHKDAEGYLVVYSKDTEDHYESWSPKMPFDEGYMRTHKPYLPSGGIFNFFAYKHLPESLQQISKPVAELASRMDGLPDGPEKSAGLRKLLEAKDCFVRASL